MIDIKLPDDITPKKAQQITLAYLKIQIEKTQKRLAVVNENLNNLEAEKKELKAYVSGMIDARKILLEDNEQELLK
jgi:uncharacterized protein YdeI (YjbR/CyaY-like superfamily)